MAIRANLKAHTLRVAYLAGFDVGVATVDPSPAKESEVIDRAERYATNQRGTFKEIDNVIPKFVRIRDEWLRGYADGAKADSPVRGMAKALDEIDAVPPGDYKAAYLRMRRLARTALETFAAHQTETV